MRVGKWIGTWVAAAALAACGGPMTNDAGSDVRTDANDASETGTDVVDAGDTGSDAMDATDVTDASDVTDATDTTDAPDASDVGMDVVDPCTACATNATCTAGVCSCPSGYSGDGTSAGSGCANVDECAGTNDCVATAMGGVCNDTDGSFTCACAAGFTGDGRTGGTGCTAVDFCSDPVMNNCVLAANGGTCANAGSTFTCGCAAGYTGDGVMTGTGCADVDECATGANDCGGDQCRNTVGSYQCWGLFGTSAFQPLFVRIDPVTGNALEQMPFPTLTGSTITGVVSIKTHPTTGLFYALLKVGGTTGRVLATIDPSTWAVTMVGNTMNNFSSLTFNADGTTLWATTGNGAMTNPESLFTLDQATAMPTLLTALGNGADGEIIEFNPTDNLLYHWSGNGTVVFESVLPTAPFTVTDIPIVGTTGGETFGAAFNPLDGHFLVSNIQSRMNDVQTNGTWGATYGMLPDDIRGLAFNRLTVRHNAAPTHGAAAGGDTVTLHGIGIGALAATGVNVVQGTTTTPATSVMMVDDNTITLVMPAGTAGAATIEAGPWTGTSLSGRWSYTYE